MNVLNIYGEEEGEPTDLPYIKKTGDTATGLIIFDGGIEVNNGTTAINGPAEFADEVLFKPSSTVVIDGSVQITGPSFEVDCPQTTFQSTNIDILGGGAAQIAIDAISNFSWDVNIDNTTLHINGSSKIEYEDTTDQDSAYTGAGALAGTYGPVQMTVDANGKITALSNAAFPSSVPSLSTNSLNIPIGGVNLNNVQSGGFNLSINNGASQCFSGSGNVTSTLVNNNVIAKKGFIITLGINEVIPPSTRELIKCLKFKVSFTYFGPDNTSTGSVDFGQTSFNIDFYPSQWTQPIDSSTESYSLSNNIGGQNSYAITPSAIAPNGRQYWVYNKQFQTVGSSGYSGWLVPIYPNTWLMTFYVPGDDVSVKYNYSACLEVLDCTSALVNGYSCGIQVSNISS
jgi:hypothetical protein